MPPSSSFIDFAKLRQQYPILDVAQKLGIKVRPDGNKHRGQCPFPDCQTLRSFTITPNGGVHGHGICGCFKCGRSGLDSIGLVQKLNDLPRMPDAARHIVELMGGKAHEPEEQGMKEVGRNFQPLSKEALLRKVAEDLDPDHERIGAAEHERIKQGRYVRVSYCRCQWWSRVVDRFLGSFTGPNS